MEALKALLDEGLYLMGCNKLVGCNTLQFCCCIINITPFHKQSESNDNVIRANARGSIDTLGLGLFCESCPFLVMLAACPSYHNLIEILLPLCRADEMACSFG